MPRRAQKVVPAGVDESTLTAENFEKELQTLAAKAKEQTTFRLTMRSVAVVLQATQILACTAVYSNLSQIALSPVYGSIPSSLWHAPLVVTACFAGWAGNAWLQRKLPAQPVAILGVIALNVPMIQTFLFQLSSYLGPRFGPALTELLTLVPLVVMSASAVAPIVEDLDLSFLPKSVAEAAPGMGSFFLFRALEQVSSPILRARIGANLLQSCLGFQVIIGGILARSASLNLLLFAFPAVFHTLFLNPHAQTSIATYDLNNNLDRKVGFKVLARQDSLTGYISVIENTREQYRVLRCDHSLLGGIWLPKDQETVSEPIYGVFAMLEAIRLVEVPRPKSSSAQNALVIGLGIGTTPSALISHGINTTTVEIDPLVRDYALEYFSLPLTHNTVIADAVTYTADLAGRDSDKYDYIVHDVFTGGAEPVDLFTTEFFTNLHSILKPTGVIAINYAGDLLLPSARLVVRTIRASFPNCRIYRENAPPSTDELAADGQDFTNMVIFCTPSASKQLAFRKPVEADYLGSRARKMFLLPQHEIAAAMFEEREGDGGVLMRNDTQRLVKWQQKSALGHWKVMRTVLPSQVWENW